MTAEQFVHEVGEVLEYLPAFMATNPDNSNWCRQIQESLNTIASNYKDTDGAEHTDLPEIPPAPPCPEP